MPTYNFSAGPAMLPTAVLEQAQQELTDYQGSGMSVMEMSHRSKVYMAIAEQAEADLREIYAIPDNYKVLFLQGGASSQFAMIPMNLLGRSAANSADYLNTGSWSKKAIAEAKRFGEVNVAASGEQSNFSHIPEPASWQLNPDASYFHYTPNETIGGVEFHFIPEVGDVPLVADMSSTILSRPLDISRYGLVYAGAQKNIGPAGLTLVIIRDDLLESSPPASVPTLPAMFNYATHANADSMYNTPPTYGWYLAGLVFKWLKAQGGVAAMAAHNQQKANTLYDAIDTSDFYQSPVEKSCRSWMNVPFTLVDPALDGEFLTQAEQAGLVNLKGHRSVGGMRASIYNAMPQSGVDALVSFMQEFEKNNG